MNDDTLILALGNTLRADDGVGCAVLNLLDELVLPQGVNLVDGGTAGLETALILQNYRRALIVDAAELGLIGGMWRRFNHQAVRPANSIQAGGTLHDAGLYEALALAEALEILPQEVIIYGIQPETIAWRPGLSPRVQNSVPQVATAILKELQVQKGKT